MLPDTYFKRNGFIYGCRERYNGNGKWSYQIIKFTNFKKAMEWKNQKECGWKRELISKDAATNKRKRFGVKQEVK